MKAKQWFFMGGGITVPAITLPVSPLGFWSTFKLSTYSGNALRVTISAVTYDIGFSGNVLNASAIRALNANDTIATTVNKIYDQSGGGFDLTIEATFTEASLYYDTTLGNYIIRFLPPSASNAAKGSPSGTLSASSYLNSSISINTRSYSQVWATRGRKWSLDPSTAYFEWGTNNYMEFISSTGPWSHDTFDGAQKGAVSKYLEGTVDFAVLTRRSNGASAGRLDIDGIFTSTNGVLANTTPTGMRLGHWSGGGTTYNMEHDFALMYVVGSEISDANVTASTSNILTAFSKTVQHNELVLCLGDSICAGYGIQKNENWPYLLYRSYGPNQSVRWINSGVAGNTIANLTTNLVNRATLYTTTPAFATTPTKKICILYVGINDIVVSARTGAQVYADIQTLVASLRSGGFTHVIGFTLFPEAAETGAQTTQRLAFNSSMVADHSFLDGFYDLTSLTWTVAGGTLLSDGIHPNATGAAQFKTAAKSVLDAII